MAGQFDSIIGISGFGEFIDAVRAVLDSRARGRSGPLADRGPRSAPARAALRGRHVRHRPRIGSQRPPRRRGRRWSTEPAGGRRGQRFATRARHARQGPRIRRGRRSQAPRPRPTAPRGSVDGCRRAPSAAHRTSNGPSRTTATCGCSSRGRSRPRSSVSLAGRCSDPVQSQKPSLSPSQSSSTTSGCRRCETQSARRSYSRAMVTRAEADASEAIISVGGQVAIDLRLAGEVQSKLTLVAEGHPTPRHPTRTQRMASRSPPSRPSRPRRTTHRTRRRRPRSRPETAGAVEPPTGRPVPPRTRRSPCPTRPRDPDGDADRHRSQPDDRSVRRAPGARGSPPRRTKRRRSAGGDPDRPRAHTPAGRAVPRAARRRRPHAPRHRRRERERQRDPAGSASPAGPVGAGADRPRRLRARSAADRVGRSRVTGDDPPHDPRARRGGVHAPGRRRPRARPNPPAPVRAAPSREVPDVRPGQGHPSS